MLDVIAALSHVATGSVLHGIVQKIAAEHSNTKTQGWMHVTSPLHLQACVFQREQRVHQPLRRDLCLALCRQKFQRIRRRSCSSSFLDFRCCLTSPSDRLGALSVHPASSAGSAVAGPGLKLFNKHAAVRPDTNPL